MDCGHTALWKTTKILSENKMRCNRYRSGVLLSQGIVYLSRMIHFALFKRNYKKRLKVEEASLVLYRNIPRNSNKNIPTNDQNWGR